VSARRQGLRGLLLPHPPEAGKQQRAGRLFSRRALLASSAAGALGSAAVLLGKRPRLLRPPGSVEEDRFLDLCIRCGECFKVCPGPVLHPSGLANGLSALWTPVVVPSIAGCHQDCNYCTQVCPTGAIDPLTIEEKRRFLMGIDEEGPCDFTVIKDGYAAGFFRNSASYSRPQGTPFLE
jgi:ferredoxin